MNDTPANPAPSAADNAPTPRTDAAIDELANAFLRWHLPESVRSDLCATMQGPGRVGTNLLSFIEAQQMMRDLIGPALAAKDAEIARLNESVTFWQNQQAATEAERDALRSEATQLRAQVVCLRPENDILKGDVAQLRARVANMEAQQRADTAELARMDAALATAKEDARSYKAARDFELANLTETRRQLAAAQKAQE